MCTRLNPVQRNDRVVGCSTSAWWTDCVGFVWGARGDGANTLGGGYIADSGARPMSVADAVVSVKTSERRHRAFICAFPMGENGVDGCGWVREVERCASASMATSADDILGMDEM